MVTEYSGKGDVDDIDDHFGQGKLHQSAVLGYTARVKILLNQEANPDLLTKRGGTNETRAAEGNTALIIAAAEASPIFVNSAIGGIFFSITGP